MKHRGSIILAIFLIAPYLVLGALFVSQKLADSRSISAAHLYIPAGSGVPSTLAEEANSLHIHIQETHAPLVQAPTLVTSEGAVIGVEKIDYFLSHAGWTKPGPSLGLRVSIMLAGLQGIIFLYRRSLALYAVLFVPIGILVAMAYAIPCVSCGSVKATDLAPTVCLVLLGSIGLVLSFQATSPRSIRHLMLAATALAPSVQAFLLFRSPLLCPLCITLGCLMGVLSYALLDLASGGTIPTLPNRAQNGYVLACSAAIIFQTGRVSLLTPNLKPTLDTEAQIVARLVGKPLAKLAPGSHEKNSVVVVTREGCSSCASAKQQLSTDHVPYKELSGCALGANEGCFDLDSTPIGFPTILFVNSKGDVQEASIGWPNDQQEVFSLTEKMKNWRNHETH